MNEKLFARFPDFKGVFKQDHFAFIVFRLRLDLLYLYLFTISVSVSFIPFGILVSSEDYQVIEAISIFNLKELKEVGRSDHDLQSSEIYQSELKDGFILSVISLML